MTRLDQYLKYTGLFKQRSGAKRACQEGRVRVDGTLAKAARDVRIGEVLTIETPTHYLEAQVLGIPLRPVPKGRRAEFCRIIEERAQERDEEEFLSFDDVR